MMSVKFRKILFFLSIVLIFGISVNEHAISIHQFNSSQTILLFSGYQWVVRSSANSVSGPGPNYFNDSIQNVWVDSNGSLHLKITYSISEDIWYCAEIFSVESFGYGTYQFILEPGFEELDENIVVGLFTYLDDFNEIDVEFSKWGDDISENGQYVLQPSWSLNHKKRFSFNPQGELTSSGFTWCKNSIGFWTNTTSSEFRWTYYGPGIPKPSSEKVHMNLWLVKGLPPSDLLETELIVKSFEFLPCECTNFFLGFWGIISISVAGIALIIICSVLIIRKKKNRYT